MAATGTVISAALVNFPLLLVDVEEGGVEDEVAAEKEEAEAKLVDEEAAEEDEAAEDEEAGESGPMMRLKVKIPPGELVCAGLDGVDCCCCC